MVPDDAAAPTSPFPKCDSSLASPILKLATFSGTTNDYNTFSLQQQRQIQNAQSQIAVETAKEPVDPMAIGTLYAGIESACRDLRDKAATSQTQNISVLTDVQKVKLNALNDAMKLAPIISEAQSGNLLGTAFPPPFALS